MALTSFGAGILTATAESRRGTKRRRLQHLCLDKGYKSTEEEQELIKRDYIVHIPIKKKEEDEGQRFGSHQKWMTTYNDYLHRLKHFFRWVYNGSRNASIINPNFHVIFAAIFNVGPEDIIWIFPPSFTIASRLDIAITGIEFYSSCSYARGNEIDTFVGDTV